MPEKTIADLEWQITELVKTSIEQAEAKSQMILDLQKQIDDNNAEFKKLQEFTVSEFTKISALLTH